MTSPELRKEAQEWLEAWYAVGDKCIPPNSIQWFAEDCVVQFNNAAPAHGKAAAQNAFSSIAPAIEWMGHEILSVDVVGDTIYNECDVTYIAKGDPERKCVKMHRMNVYKRVARGKPEEGKITCWMAFFDSSPLQERIALANGGARVY